ERTNLNFKIIRTFNNCSLDDFKLSLSFETWETVFNAEDNNIDSVFNNFVDVYLQIFNACFPKKKIYEHFSSKQWLTTGIKTSCRRKRELYLLAKFHDNENLKQYYKSYCKILTKVINEAKRLSNEDKITNSNNVAKTTWNIIRAELGKDCSKGKICNTVQINSSNFNNYFLNVADNITQKISSQFTSDTDSNNKYKYYLNLAAKGPFPKIIFNNKTTKEIEK
ncbi:hypothetical protein B7P43_G03095, partial [Cryptotermes secundus]